MDAPKTANELQEILRIHAAWVIRQEDGQGADLRGANLGGAKLQGANLRDANLQGANLWGAKLQDANLGDADLEGANLGGAKLQGANLGGAKLQGANLGDADLEGANLGGAKLQGANLILIGQDMRGFLFYAWKNDDDVVVIRAGCRLFVGMEEARTHWQSRHTDEDVLHADCLSLVDRCETMAAARGWNLEAVAVPETA